MSRTVDKGDHNPLFTGGHRHVPLPITWRQ